MANWKDSLHLHLIVLIWGFTAILGLLMDLPAVELVFFRTLLASVMLYFLLYTRKRSLQLSLPELLKIAGTGLLIGAHWILFFASAKVSTASVCLAGMTTGTLWTSFVEPWVYRRKIRIYEIILACIIILGLYVIFRFEFNHVLGLSLAILSALLAALFSVFNSVLVKKHDHYVITFYEMSAACLGIALYFPLYQVTLAEGGSLVLNPSLKDWFYLLVLSGICTVYAYSASIKLMHKFSPYAINLTVNLEPVYGIVLAFLIFGDQEKMTGGFYGGTLIILVAVLSYPYIRKLAKSWEKGETSPVVHPEKSTPESISS